MHNILIGSLLFVLLSYHIDNEVNVQKFITYELKLILVVRIPLCLCYI